MAKENPGWGYTRLMGAMENLGHTIGRRTVKRILEDHGIRPAYDRSREGSWKAFLKAHWESLAATDFFTVEIWTSKGLVRYFVLLVIEYHTRRVHIAGISPEPNGAWVEQLGRNLVDPYDGFLKGKKFLIHDRDPLFTARFRETLKSVGCQCIRLPKRSPNLNAYVERFVRSIKYECLNKMILFGESHLGHVVKEYVTHYNAERNHQGMENRLLSTNGPRGEIHQEKLFVKRGWGEC
jgi:putative transposase